MAIARLMKTANANSSMQGPVRARQPPEKTSSKESRQAETRTDPKANTCNRTKMLAPPSNREPTSRAETTKEPNARESSNSSSNSNNSSSRDRHQLLTNRGVWTMSEPNSNSRCESKSNDLSRRHLTRRRA